MQPYAYAPRVGSVTHTVTRDASVVAFESWLVAREPALQRLALLLTNDEHAARDLVQITLAKLYLAWDRLDDRDRVDAYARRATPRTCLPTASRCRHPWIFSLGVPQRPGREIPSGRNPRAR